MRFITDFIKGIFVGVANVIPGVSGGTMAVSFGIYDKLLNAISNLLKEFKKSFKTLLPIFLGMAVGIIAFTFILPVMLKEQPFTTSSAFTGLIIGGLPALLSTLSKTVKENGRGSVVVNVIVFMLMFALAAAMPFFKGDKESGMLLAVNAKNLIMVPIMGILAAAAMVIPGVSGSLMLMIFGYYFGIVTAVKDFFTALKSFDIGQMVDRGLILGPLAIGCVLGLFFISKLISWLLKKYPVATYAGILGLVAASPISIYYKVDQEYPMESTSLTGILIGILVCVACMFVTIFIGKMGNKDEITE